MSKLAQTARKAVSNTNYSSVKSTSKPSAMDGGDLQSERSCRSVTSSSAHAGKMKRVLRTDTSKSSRRSAASMSSASSAGLSCAASVAVERSNNSLVSERFTSDIANDDLFQRLQFSQNSVVLEDASPLAEAAAPRVSRQHVNGGVTAVSKRFVQADSAKSDSDDNIVESEASEITFAADSSKQQHHVVTPQFQTDLVEDGNIDSTDANFGSATTTFSNQSNTFDLQQNNFTSHNDMATTQNSSFTNQNKFAQNQLLPVGEMNLLNVRIETLEAALQKQQQLENGGHDGVGDDDIVTNQLSTGGNSDAAQSIADLRQLTLIAVNDLQKKFNHLREKVGGVSSLAERTEQKQIRLRQDTYNAVEEKLHKNSIQKIWGRGFQSLIFKILMPQCQKSCHHLIFYQI